MLRLEANKNTTLGIEISKCLALGNFVSDEITNLLIQQFIRTHQSHTILFDGYPRNLKQAKYFSENIPDVESFLNVIHIMIPEHIAIHKMLGRRTCRTCGRGFNIHDVYEGNYIMPKILPDENECPLQSKCNPVLITRNDDKVDIIRKRLEIYKIETLPILKYYDDKHLLQSFMVEKGISDTPKLIEMMLS
jgi:adenylate kinase